MPSEQDIDWRRGEALPQRRPRTLAELIAGCCERFGGETVLVDGDQAWTWRELDHAAARLAARWAAALPAAARVLILAGNGPAHLLAELAAWRLNAVPAPLPRQLAAEHMRELVRAVDPALIVVDDDASADSLGRSTRITVSELLRLARRPGPHAEPRVQDARDPCLLLHTGGSGGRARGVLLCHDNLCSQQAAFAELWPEIGPDDRLAAYLPWHHSFGALAERLWALSRGACLHVVPGGGRDRDSFLACLRQVRPTVFMSVPRLHRCVCEHDALDRGSIRWAFTAGAPLGRFEEDWYRARGILLYEGWGLTECSPSATITPPGRPRRSGVVGMPIPGVAVGVRRDDGHVLVDGPGVMLGYHGDAAATAAALVGGVLDSGDIGRWCADGLQLLGRVDHLLKLDNGEKVAAVVIERRLERQPGVRHAVVLLREGRLTAALDCDGDRAAALAAVQAVNAMADRHERIAGVFVLEEAMSVANGLLTPAHKIARAAVADHVDKATALGC